MQLGDLVKNVREAERRTGELCAVMLDTTAPEIIVGKLAGGSPVELAVGHPLKLLCNAGPGFSGTDQALSVNAPMLPSSVRPGMHINMDGGAVVCRVDSVLDSEDAVLTTILSATVALAEGVHVQVVGG